MKKEYSKQQGFSGVLLLLIVVIVVSIGATAYILFAPSKQGRSNYQFPFTLRNQKRSRPASGFGDFGLDESIETEEPLSASDVTSTIEGELAGTVFADFDEDLAELDSLINGL